MGGRSGCWWWLGGAALAALASGCGDDATVPTDGGDEATTEVDVVEAEGDGGDVAGTTTDRIEQYGVSWTFDRAVPYGQFANGDYWVVGPVTVVAVSPGFDGAHHGWEVNPADPVQQGFDERVADFDASRVPALPFAAMPGQSLVQGVSLEPLDDVDCRPCLRTAAVLTVLGEVPPDEGRTVFRPPYFGADKPLVSTAGLRAELLPSLAPTASTPALGETADAFRRVQLDHKTNWTGRALHPSDNLPDYGSSIASRNADGALRLLLDDAASDKRELLIQYVQYGLDLYGMWRGGVSWPPNGGHSEGRKLPIAVAALLLDDAVMQEAVGGAGDEDFGENGGIYASEEAGVALYGQGDGEESYWRNMVFDTGSRTLSDPYRRIDGGYRPGDSYQFCCTSMVWKSTAAAVLLLPGLEAVWGDAEFLEYVERWVEHGAWTQPDPCAPADGVCAGGDNVGAPCTTASEAAVCTGEDAVCDLTGSWDAHYGVTYGPDGAGGCIADADPSDGTGRYPDRHGAATNDGYYQSGFANELWDAYVP
jgi:hypothetical protein